MKVEVNLNLTVDASLQCAAHWTVFTETHGFVVTDQAHGSLDACLEAVRSSVNEHFQIERARQ